MDYHIAIFLPSLAGGGAEKIMVTVANHMAESGNRVDLVLSKATGPYLDKVSSDVNIVDLNASRVLFSLPKLVIYLTRNKPTAMLSALNYANLLAYTTSLSQSRFVRNVAIVAMGTASAQAINIVFAPIITRLYGPEAFGVFGTFTAVLAILAPLGALSYPIAIVLPKRNSDAIGIARMSLIIAICTSLVVAVMLFSFGQSLITLFNLQIQESLILVFPLGMLFAACLAVANHWAIRQKLFKLKAKVAVIQALWLNGAKAGIGMMMPIAAVLVVLAALGTFVHAAMLYAGIKKRAGEMHSNIAGSDIPLAYRELAWRHRDFPYYRTPQIILNEASQSLPVLMLVSLFDPISAGFYVLGRMVMSTPSALVGNAVGDVFYPRVADAAMRGEPIAPLVIKATILLLIIGALPFGIVVIAGPSLFSLIFGSEWLVAGEYARWTAIWLLFMFANQPSIKALPVLSAQRFHLVFTCFSIALRAVGLSIGYFVFFSDLVAVALFGIVSMLLYIFFILVTVYLCFKFDRSKREVYV